MTRTLSVGTSFMEARRIHLRLVPVLRAAAGGCGTLAGAGGRVADALVVIVRNRTGKIHGSHFMTTRVNATPVTCVRTAKSVVHTTVAVKMGFSRRRNEIEGSRQGTRKIDTPRSKSSPGVVDFPRMCALRTPCPQ